MYESYFKQVELSSHIYIKYFAYCHCLISVCVWGGGGAGGGGAIF